MALSENLYRTVDTLKELGYSNRMIATVIGVHRQQVNDYVTANGLSGTKGKKLKLADYKNAALVNLAVNAADEKHRISALNSLDMKNDDTGSVQTTTTTTTVKQEILDELQAK